MKRFITSIVVVITLSALPSGLAYGQVKRPPGVKPSDVISPKNSGAISPKVLGTLDIKRFDAIRGPDGIRITGEIRNTLARGTDSLVTWSILKLNDKTWAKIKTGTGTVKAYSTLLVPTVISASNDALRLRFDVSSSNPSLYTSKEFSLAAAKTETAGAGGVEPQNTPTTSPSSATLTLLSLECFKTEDGSILDGNNTDEIELRVFFGNARSNFKVGRSMNITNRGTFAWVLPDWARAPRKITGDVRVELWELDTPDPDDNLGRHTIRVGDSFGEKKQAFNGDGALYVLHYRLDP